MQEVKYIFKILDLYQTFVTLVRRAELPIVSIVPWHGALSIEGPCDQLLDCLTLEK